MLVVVNHLFMFVFNSQLMIRLQDAVLFTCLILLLFVDLPVEYNISHCAILHHRTLCIDL